MLAIELAEKLRANFGEQLSSPMEFRGEVTLALRDAEKIEAVTSFAKHQLGFDYLVDISSVDLYGEEPRFLVVYELYGFGHRAHLRLKVAVPEEGCELPTVSSVWRTANWHEREIYDMMGIRFRGHPDLRRILMWEGYPYFPLRKDFPLAGKPTDLPEVAFTSRAPMEGGPFVTVAGGKDTISREPRVRRPEEEHLETNARLERRRDLGRADEQGGKAAPK